MSDLRSEGIEPTARVIEPQGSEPRGQPDTGSRRRRPPVRDESDLAENLETPAHQVDRLA
jgi:hypothetical protein